MYALQAGGDDPQTPHTEDEAYHVLSGRASIWIAGSVLAVEPGSVVFVEKNRLSSVRGESMPPRRREGSLGASSDISPRHTTVAIARDLNSHARESMQANHGDRVQRSLPPQQYETAHLH